VKIAALVALRLSLPEAALRADGAQTAARFRAA
jgi:hypothetical protein